MPPSTLLTPRVPWPSEWGTAPWGGWQHPHGAGVGTLPTLSPARRVPTLSPSACPQAAAAAAGGGQVQQSHTREGPGAGPRPCRRCCHLRALLEAGAGPVCPVCQGEWGLLASQGCPVGGHCCPGTSPQTSQVSELEKRLAQLEAAMRCEPDSQVSAQVRGAALPPSWPSANPILYLPSPV